jgi:hypothetical protein
MFISISPSHLHLDLPRGPYPLAPLTKILYGFPISFTCTAHPIHSSLNFINTLISDEYNLWSSTLHDFIQFSVTFSLLHSNIHIINLNLCTLSMNPGFKQKVCNTQLWTLWHILLRIFISKFFNDFVILCFVNTMHNLKRNALYL